MEFHEYREIISIAKFLKAILEEETQSQGEEKELCSFEEIRKTGDDIEISLSFNMAYKAIECKWKYPVKEYLFKKYFILTLNKYKNEIFKYLISVLQEELTNSKNEITNKFCELIEDGNNLTK